MATEEHPIYLYNTLTRSKVPLKPLDGKRVRMYTCGPTVYHYAHIGNLRAYVFADTLKRAIMYNKVPVLHVMNITDVGHLTSDADEGEDKMLKGARREGKSAWEIAEYYTKAFQDDLKRLNVLFPDIWCKATEHIKEQIAQIQALEKKGYTYRIEDGIYFDTSKVPDYGKLARLDLENLKAGARVEMAEGKRNPTDFALWKFSRGERRQMEWDSPWGVGFPGWHIECSAMSMKYLGDQFDIHTGGIDHIPVHHTNEIAQAESATGKKPWVQIWMHNEFLVINEGKMAKSSGDFLRLQTIIDHGIDPIVYRYFLLTAGYDQQLAFSWEALEGAKNSLKSIKTKIHSLAEEKATGKSEPGVEHEHKAAFLEAINDNLNTPKALAALWAVLRDDRLANERKLELAREFDEVLGLGLFMRATLPGEAPATHQASIGGASYIVKKIPLGDGVDVTLFDDAPQEVVELARQRHLARKGKDWKRSDELRNEINSRGYIIDDKKDGYAIRKG
jgi:cysteinyl-tRNA synthetase